MKPGKRTITFRLVALLLGLIGALVLAEVTAQIYVRHVVRRGKLFRPDPVLGWSVLPDLDLTRLNSAGSAWRVITDTNGLRGPAEFSGEPRLLFLGDSFAFGEGVEVERRFDTQLDLLRPGGSMINLGVMGYGTDQQLLSAGPWLDRLGEGDVVVLLTYANDFLDLQRRRQSGRPKPWYTLDGDQLTGNMPSIRWKDRLRDRSYLAAWFLSRRGGPAIADAPRAFPLYSALVERFAIEIDARGIRLVLATHGDALLGTVDPSPVYDELCRNPPISCLRLDPLLGPRGDNPHYLPDGHWSHEGHAVVARALEAHLAGLQFYGDASEGEQATPSRIR